MTLADMDAVTMPPAAANAVPVIIGIGLDETTRRRLATHAGGVGVMMFAPDAATAQQLLFSDGGSRPEATGDEPPESTSTVRVGDLEVDGTRCQVRWRGAPLGLSKQERELLSHLAVDRPRVWTYRQLHEAAWDCHYTGAGPVRAAVKRLRRKLRQFDVPMQVEAVRGIGYQLVMTDG